MDSYKTVGQCNIESYVFKDHDTIQRLNYFLRYLNINMKEKSVEIIDS